MMSGEGEGRLEDEAMTSETAAEPVLLSST